MEHSFTVDTVQFDLTIPRDARNGRDTIKQISTIKIIGNRNKKPVYRPCGCRPHGVRRPFACRFDQAQTSVHNFLVVGLHLGPRLRHSSCSSVAVAEARQVMHHYIAAFNVDDFETIGTSWHTPGWLSTSESTNSLKDREGVNPSPPGPSGDDGAESNFLSVEACRIGRGRSASTLRASSVLASRARDSNWH